MSLILFVLCRRNTIGVRDALRAVPHSSHFVLVVWFNRLTHFLNSFLQLSIAEMFNKVYLRPSKSPPRHLRFGNKSTHNRHDLA